VYSSLCNTLKIVANALTRPTTPNLYKGQKNAPEFLQGQLQKLPSKSEPVRKLGENLS